MISGSYWAISSAEPISHNRPVLEGGLFTKLYVGNDGLEAAAIDIRVVRPSLMNARSNSSQEKSWMVEIQNWTFNSMFVSVLI